MRRHTPPKTSTLPWRTAGGHHSRREQLWGALHPETPTSRETVSGSLHTDETGSSEQSLFKMPMVLEEGTGARVPHLGLLREVS